jgi:hypothetical protein
LTVAPHWSGLVETVTSAGQEMVQGCAETVTVNEHVAVLPAESVVVQLTVVGPTWNVEPDGGVQFVVTGQLLTTVGAG